MLLCLCFDFSKWAWRDIDLVICASSVGGSTGEQLAVVLVTAARWLCATFLNLKFSVKISITVCKLVLILYVNGFCSHPLILIVAAW